ncbi:hypothetical protein D3Z46_05275, partial [Bacteroides sartorii]|nr:hypothetical protein [Phocaeicola sartorii]
MKGRRRTTIFRPGLMSNLIIYYKLINYKCMDNIMKCTPLDEQKSLWLRKTTALSFKISSHSRHVLFYSESSTDGE